MSQVMIVDGTPVQANFLEQQLLTNLRQNLPQAENSSLVLAARTADDQIIGGLVGGTSYNWLLVKILWVQDAFQRQGIGRDLMQQAEARARTLGCHGAWLDTSNPAALSFYLRLGYEVFGELGNTTDQFPSGHRRWIMRKML